jgi:hypothetical protein
MPRKPKREPLTHEQQCEALLAGSLPPNADEFDRLCYFAQARFLKIQASEDMRRRLDAAFPDPYPRLSGNRDVCR